MTTIVWKNGQIAADRQGSDDNLAIAVRKLDVYENVAIACAGVYEEGEQFKEWYFEPEGKCPLKKTDALIMDLDTGECFFWEAKAKDERPIVDEFTAIGSGAQLALGALEAGASIRRAMEIACKRDTGTGLGIDYAKAKRGTD